MKNGIINIHGREYKTVALRVQEFRERHPDWSIITEIVSIDEIVVLMKATVSDHTGRVIGVGHAEEVRAASKINKTSAVENAETSAIGRALAACGFGGSEYASANEVANAIAQQEAPRISEQQVADLEALIEDVGADRDAFLAYMRITDLKDLPEAAYGAAVKSLERKRKKVSNETGK